MDVPGTQVQPGDALTRLVEDRGQWLVSCAWLLYLANLDGSVEGSGYSGARDGECFIG